VGVKAVRAGTGAIITRHPGHWIPQQVDRLRTIRLDVRVPLAEIPLKDGRSSFSANLVGFSTKQRMEAVWLYFEGLRTEGKMTLR